MSDTAIENTEATAYKTNLHELSKVLSTEQIPHKLSEDKGKLFIKDDKFNVTLVADESGELFLRVYEKGKELKEQNDDLRRMAKFRLLRKLHQISDNFLDSSFKLEALPPSPQEIKLFKNDKPFNPKNLMDY